MENTKLDWSRFERAWTAQIVESINTVRAELGLTVRDLANRVRNLGWNVSDATMSGMLSGGKRGSISVAEIAIFAQALSTTPMYLMLGLPKASSLPDHAMLPERARDIYSSHEWLAGFAADPYLVDGEPADGSIETMRSTRFAIYFVDRTNQISRTVWSKLDTLAALRNPGPLPADWVNERTATLERSIERDLSALRRLRKRQAIMATDYPLARLHILEMPDHLEFVDGDSSILEELQKLSASMLASLVSPDSLAKAKAKLEESYDEETNDLPERTA